MALGADQWRLVDAGFLSTVLWLCLQSSWTVTTTLLRRQGCVLVLGKPSSPYWVLQCCMQTPSGRFLDFDLIRHVLPPAASASQVGASVLDSKWSRHHIGSALFLPFPPQFSPFPEARAVLPEVKALYHPTSLNLHLHLSCA